MYVRLITYANEPLPRYSQKASCYGDTQQARMSRRNYRKLLFL